MSKSNARYTLEFKREAVRLVRNGQSQAQVGQQLGVAGQTLHNWVKAESSGRLSEPASGGQAVTAEQMEISRLKSEVARLRMERDILKKAAAYFAKESL